MSFMDESSSLAVGNFGLGSSLPGLIGRFCLGSEQFLKQWNNVRLYLLSAIEFSLCCVSCEYERDSICKGKSSLRPLNHYCVPQLVHALGLVNVAGFISLYSPLNSIICLIWNIPPIFEPRDIINISLPLFLGLHRKLRKLVFFCSVLACALRVGPRTRKMYLKARLSYI